MGNFKLIALDLDGTLLDKKHQISDENRRAVLDAVHQGVNVILTTGRGIQRTLPHIEQLGLRAPVVTVNGGEVWKSPQQLFSRKHFEPETIWQLRQMAMECGTGYWAVTTEKVIHREEWIDNSESAVWLKFGFKCEDEEVLRKIRRQLESWNAFEIANSHPTNLEINPKGVNKLTGVLSVCGLIGIDISEVVAMGDSLNDIELIRAAGLGVAMGNAQEEVKRAAKTVTGSNVEHGVAEAIRKYVLN